MAGSGSGPSGTGAPGGRSGGPDVPRAVLRSWDQAEARLFPLVMARPDLYQRSMSMIQRLLGYLRETCPDIPALLAAHERGGDLVAEGLPGGPAGEAAGGLAGEAASWAATETGPGLGLIAAAACAMRYRELMASQAAQHRLDALARAREQGLSWVVVGETGSADLVPYTAYQRVEADVASGRAVIVSIEPDETLTRAVHRLDAGQVDLVTGALRIGETLGSYPDADALGAALRRARGEAGGTRPAGGAEAERPEAGGPAG